ncbi:hypothetical protein BHE90_016823 [Fusarium euwallaceae]|uniref:Uncharacterized protein n=3 Tax=Fusarium solani species complex TaxID=232080 RepID=A0A428TRL4_9HYPO|nr:hypothetical protein CEP51_015370 [Fusarium floridanum]RSM04671.1 hypothetical protein CEP52_006685 [Fusarium oligoseptatum]RTE68799.1 hypothetical protein BHE90_016823 [Fusarium euwallaceae]
MIPACPSLFKTNTSSLGRHPSLSRPVLELFETVTDFALYPTTILLALQSICTGAFQQDDRSVQPLGLYLISPSTLYNNQRELAAVRFVLA